MHLQADVVGNERAVLVQTADATCEADVVVDLLEVVISRSTDIDQ